MHINVKPLSRHQVYETAEQAIFHVIVNKCFAQSKWQDVSFGRDIADIRRVNDAIKNKDESAFKASKRRGYWRVELI